MTLTYDQLDPSARYVVRLSVRGRSRWRSDSSKAPQLEEGLEADGRVISDGFPVLTVDATFQEFDLPAETTQDGRVELSLTSKSRTRPFTAALEVWLMRKDRVPWTVRF